MEEEKRTRDASLYVLAVTLLADCVRVQEVEDGREHRLARDLLVERRDREARATPLAALQAPLRAAVDRHAARRLGLG